MCIVYFHMFARNSATRRSYWEPHTCADYCRVGVYNGAAIKLQIGVLIGENKMSEIFGLCSYNALVFIMRVMC